jgi:hypothetical protein
MEETCIKHRLGKVSVKMCDKFGKVLRLEATTNDVSFFKPHRKVEHRNRPETSEIAPLKKSIYSIIDLRGILLGCNRRYPEYLSALDDFSAGNRNLQRFTDPMDIGGQILKGFNFFDRTQQEVLRALQRPEFNLRGIRRADLARFLPDVSLSRISRFLWRLRKFKIIKKVAHIYCYYLTRVGRCAIAAACRIVEQTIVPTLMDTTA